MDKKKYTGRIRNKTILVFIVMFIGINCAVHLQIMNRINEEKLKATYTAEATVRRIEAQINKYLSKSDLLKQIIESESTISDEHFTELSGFMMADDDVIDVIELAKGGTVSSVYPLSGNEEAMGLDIQKNRITRIYFAMWNTSCPKIMSPMTTRPSPMVSPIAAACIRFITYFRR